MPRLRLHLLVVFSLLALAVFATSAAAKVPSPVADCQAHQGTLTHHYTAKQLQAALNKLPSSTKEYTTCYNAIYDQLQSQLGHTGTNINGQHPNGAGSGASGSGTLILIIVIVVVILLGGGGALWAYRRNRDSAGPAA